MKRAFSVPFIAIFVAVFIALPAVFWIIFSNNSQPKVKGASISQDPSQLGFGVAVNTKSTTWDLYEYLCTDKDSCLSSADAGDKVQIISGGATTDFLHVFSPTDTWSKYKYAKVFIKPAWGSQGSRFYGSKGPYSGIEIYDLEKDGVLTSTALIPLENFVTSYGLVATFSN